MAANGHPVDTDSDSENDEGGDGHAGIYGLGGPLGPHQDALDLNATLNGVDNTLAFHVRRLRLGLGVGLNRSGGRNAVRQALQYIQTRLTPGSDALRQLNHTTVRELLAHIRTGAKNLRESKPVGGLTWSELTLIEDLCSKIIETFAAGADQHAEAP